MARRCLALCLIATAFATPAAAQKGDGKKPPDDRDAFGRVKPWSDEVGGARVRLRLVRERLLYGEPIGFIVDARHASEKGPFVRLYWDGPGTTARLELKTDRGEAVLFTRQSFGDSDSIVGAHHTGRLWPQGKFALGRYFAPGKYRLRLLVEADRNKLDARSWEGKFTTPEVAFEVIEPGENARRELVPPPLREKAAAWIRDLDSAKFAEREAADKALRAVALDVLPLLEEKLQQARRTEERVRAERIVRDALAPLARGMLHRSEALPQETGPVLALLGEESWRLLDGHFEGGMPKHLRALAAAFGPVGPYRDLTKPAEKEVDELVARMKDEDPAVRVRAVRSLSKTADARLLAALAERLKDRFTYHVGLIGHPAPFALVAHEAKEALIWQGKPAVEAAIGLGKANPSSYRGVLDVLAGIGPDERSLAYLSEVMDSDDGDVRWSASEALMKQGKAAAPLLYRAARDGKERGPMRREAVRALGRLGDPKTHGAFLLELLRGNDGELQGAAAEAVGELKMTEALPALARVARDEKIDQNVRYAAMNSHKALAPRKDTEALLLELLERKGNAGVRGLAMVQLAFFGSRAGLPAMLEALDDKEWYVRSVADGALRVLSGRREGVGYDPRQPDAKRWRDWWKEHQ